MIIFWNEGGEFTVIHISLLYHKDIWCGYVLLFFFDEQCSDWYVKL